jgi:hypothetical protein
VDNFDKSVDNSVDNYQAAIGKFAIYAEAGYWE